MHSRCYMYSNVFLEERTYANYDKFALTVQFIIVCKYVGEPPNPIKSRKKTKEKYGDLSLLNENLFKKQRADSHRKYGLSFRYKNRM